MGTARRLTIILVAMLAVAAAAFAEVDGWERAKNVPYCTGDEPLGVFGADGEGAFNKRALLWSAGWGNTNLSYIRVVYLDWDLYCETANLIMKKEPGRAEALKEEVELNRPSYKDKIRFRVTIAAGDIRESRINNAACWTIYLLTEDGLLAPEGFEHVEDADTVSTRMISYGGVLPTWNYAYVTKTYDVTFSNPYNEVRPVSLKLCIEGEHARRGFEWRFKKPTD